MSPWKYSRGQSLKGRVIFPAFVYIEEVHILLSYFPPAARTGRPIHHRAWLPFSFFSSQASNDTSVLFVY